jgi:anaerobic ribonucleoside-triphosphate reductase activating protein
MKEYENIEFKINYGNIKFFDVSDGPGIRVALYVSGCNFHCEGCHNEEAWNFNFGTKFTHKHMKLILDLLKKKDNSIDRDGLSILGGEPLDPKNRSDVLSIIEIVKEQCPDKTIWLWTGFTYEKIVSENIIPKNILEKIDVIVDGQFVLAERDISLKYRGSKNQRVIDVQKTLKENMITYYC